MDVVIIGGNAAGAKAAARIRRLDSKARITVLEQGDVASYAGCGLPYYVSGKTPDLDALLKTSYGMVRDRDYFARVQGVEVRTNWRAEEIDLGARVVRARPLPPARGTPSPPRPAPLLEVPG